MFVKVQLDYGGIRHGRKAPQGSQYPLKRAKCVVRYAGNSRMSGWECWEIIVEYLPWMYRHINATKHAFVAHDRLSLSLRAVGPQMRVIL